MAAEATPKLPKGRGLWDNRILQYHRHMEALEESEAGTYLLARRSGGEDDGGFKSPKGVEGQPPAAQNKSEVSLSQGRSGKSQHII